MMKWKLRREIWPEEMSQREPSIGHGYYQIEEGSVVVIIVDSKIIRIFLFVYDCILECIILSLLITTSFLWAFRLEDDQFDLPLFIAWLIIDPEMNPRDLYDLLVILLRSLSVGLLGELTVTFITLTEILQRCPRCRGVLHYADEIRNLKEYP